MAFHRSGNPMSAHESEPTGTPRPQARTPMESLQAWGMVTPEQVQAAESAAEASGASRRITTPAQPSANLLAATVPDAPLPDLDEVAPVTAGAAASADLELAVERVQSAPRRSTPPASASPAQRPPPVPGSAPSEGALERPLSWLRGLLNRD